MSKRYFRHLFNSGKNVNIVITVILFILMVLNSIIFVDSNDQYFNTFGTYGTFAGIVIVMIYILPVANFRYLHSQRAVDTYMQLPISKTEVFVTKYLYTIFQILGPWLINFILANLVFVAKGYASFLDINYILFLLVVLTLFTMALTAFNIYIYQLCNNMIDGMIMIIMYHLLLVAAAFGIGSFVDSHTFVNTFDFDKVSFLILDYNFFKMIIPEVYFNCEWVIAVISSKGFIFTLFVGLLSFILAFHDIRHRASERAENNTDNYLCYPLIIVSFVFIIMIQTRFTSNDYYLQLMLTFVPYMIGIFLYKRQVKIKIRYILVFVGLIFISAGASLLFVNMNGFDVDKGLPDEYKHYEISLYDSGEQLYYFNDSDQLDEVYEVVEGLYEENRIRFYDTYYTKDFHYDSGYYLTLQYSDKIYPDNDFYYDRYIYLYADEADIKMILGMVGE